MKALLNWLDQRISYRHLLNHALNEPIPSGARFRYVTGSPYTPVATSIYNANTDTYKPVYAGVNSARSAPFHRLDVRLERSWALKRGSLAAYLDVQNVYNRPSDEGRVYNYNFTQSGTIPGLPIIPSVGMRGEI